MLCVADLILLVVLNIQKARHFVVVNGCECDIFPFSALTLLVGQQEGHPACKKLVVGLLVVMI